MWPRQGYTSMVKYYGNVGTNQTLLQIPYPMVLAWDLDVKITRMSIHEKCHDSALRVFNKIKDHYSPAEMVEHGLNLFGGCLNVRRMRGGRQWSMHAWGTAIDIDPIRNQLKWHKNQAHLATPACVPYFEFWEEEGWVSLGRKRDFDWMHVQAARL